jgi:hypothetical protein
MMIRDHQVVGNDGAGSIKWLLSTAGITGIITEATDSTTVSAPFPRATGIPDQQEDQRDPGIRSASTTGE